MYFHNFVHGRKAIHMILQSTEAHTGIAVDLHFHRCRCHYMVESLDNQLYHSLLPSNQVHRHMSGTQWSIHHYHYTPGHLHQWGMS